MPNKWFEVWQSMFKHPVNCPVEKTGTAQNGKGFYTKVVSATKVNKQTDHCF